MAVAVGLRLGHIGAHVVDEPAKRGLRHIVEQRGCAEDHEQQRRPKLRVIASLPPHPPQQGGIHARGADEEDGEAGDDEERRPRADIRLDEIDALAPVREIERHERGGREAVPDDAVVGVLDERHDERGEIEQREQRAAKPRMAGGGERAREAHERQKDRRADDEVEADERLIPDALIRPGVEQRKGGAPAEPRRKMEEPLPRKERQPRRALREHEQREHRQRDGQEIVGAHVLADVAVKGDEADEINTRGSQLADQRVLLVGGNSHDVVLPFPSYIYCMRRYLSDAILHDMTAFVNFSYCVFLPSLIQYIPVR